MATQTKYLASNLYTMVTEFIKELGLDDKYSVLDVRSFGYTPDHEPMPCVWLEVFVRDESGVKIGTEYIQRFIDHDVNYADWGVPPTDYPVIA